MATVSHEAYLTEESEIADNFDTVKVSFSGGVVNDRISSTNLEIHVNGRLLQKEVQYFDIPKSRGNNNRCTETKFSLSVWVSPTFALQQCDQFRVLIAYRPIQCRGPFVIRYFRVRLSFQQQVHCILTASSGRPKKGCIVLTVQVVNIHSFIQYKLDQINMPIKRSQMKTREQPRSLICNVHCSFLLQ
ncbi:hypothetical protein DPMN_076194 [Dreissena polymorpha]|uniref:Uncharacterized protein n=1 Tax=Dreissena polymorpha TaxID=45954 RepID=A0A9D3YJN6_DREPO|nr:hypothetical protein DPMN_076194 [Dreissena polymorpha]